MSKQCYDCFYYSNIYRRTSCKKKNKSIHGADDICSSFVPEDVKTCLYCEYYCSDSSYFAKNDDGVCNRNKKSIKNDDIACSYFIES